MATLAGLHLSTECFAKIGDNNRAIFETFVRAANTENQAFMHHRMGQRTQFSERLHRQAAELLSAQQDFVEEAANDWIEQAHKLGKLYWQTLEDRMEETTDIVASILPFPHESGTPANRRKAA